MKPQVALSHRCRHFEIVVITAPQMADSDEIWWLHAE